MRFGNSKILDCLIFHEVFKLKQNHMDTDMCYKLNVTTKKTNNEGT